MKRAQFSYFMSFRAGGVLDSEIKIFRISLVLTSRFLMNVSENEYIMQFHSLHRFSVWLHRIANVFTEWKYKCQRIERHQILCQKQKTFFVYKTFFSFLIQQYWCFYIDMYTAPLCRNICNSMQQNWKTAQSTKLHFVGVQHFPNEKIIRIKDPVDFSNRHICLFI